MGKKVKRADLLEYAYYVLHENWPKVNKKLGLDVDAFQMPTIKFTKEDSEFNSGNAEFISINYKTALQGYKKKRIFLQNLEIKCEKVFEEDIVHECIHYIQNEFYDLDLDCYDYVTEGLASLVTVEVQLDNNYYELASTSIADHFIESKRNYKDYFNLPEKYNKHIEDIIKDEFYKPVTRNQSYSKGFMHICADIGRSDNYLHILINPFKNSDVDVED